MGASRPYVIRKLIRSLKKGSDNSGLVGTILMDLSKAYNCLPHDLSIAKLEAYGLDKPSLNLVNGYLRFWKQREKIGSSYSDWANATRLFDIFINDIFLFIEILIYTNLLMITHCSLVEIISQWFCKK